MNILLIHPYINSSTPVLYLNEPIGLISLATVLEENAPGDRKIEILDLYALGNETVTRDGDYYNIGLSDPADIMKAIEKFNPDIIGITSNFTTYTKAVFDLTNLIKLNKPDILLVLGGAHVTMDAHNTLSKFCRADIVVRGEGEETFSELVKRIEQGRSLADLSGITYRRGGEIVSNQRRALINDINALPIPDRRFINQDLYSEINKKMYFLSRGRKVAAIMTSRGCPFNCIFCSTKIVWEKKFRARSPRLVIEEMEYLITNYKIDEFLINDDQFFFDKNRALAICDMIIERGWKVSLNIAAGSSVWIMDEKLLKRLKEAGMYRITFPIETGNKKTIKYIRKPINLDKTKKLIDLANSLGLYTYANFIIGFPYETREDIQETIGYAFKTGLDNATFFVAKPYAGSEMYEDFLKEGLLDHGVLKPTTMGEVDHRIIHLTAKELQQIRNNAQRKYFLQILKNYFNPLFFHRYFYPKINSVDGMRYFIRLVKSSLTTLFIMPISRQLSSKMRHR